MPWGTQAKPYSESRSDPSSLAPLNRRKRLRTYMEKCLRNRFARCLIKSKEWARAERKGGRQMWRDSLVRGLETQKRRHMPWDTTRFGSYIIIYHFPFAIPPKFLSHALSLWIVVLKCWNVEQKPHQRMGFHSMLLAGSQLFFTSSPFVSYLVLEI